ncbi:MULTISPECIES: S53 family peptidase [Kitasatospora]|uniref:S53 family peptidase n=1 Tax=Kitasatospora TaxID=2063 RepID=UPI000CBFE8F9|nr:S53 family peptidase [Kitasatospora sp. GP30]MDH6140236.1 kumamolisin [Kitasatospora sp. GP30]
MTPHRLKVLGALAAPMSVIAALALTTPAHAAPQPQLAVHGDVVKALAQSVRTGDVAPTDKKDVTVSLAVRDQAGLQSFLKQVSDPKSPQYKHYLTVKQFADRFGASDKTISQVTDYLKSQGLAVGKLSANHLTVTASGSAQQLEKAFNTHLATFHDNHAARDYFANTSAPTLPATFASQVVDVAGLNNYTVHSHFSHANPAVKPSATADASAGLDPTSGKAAYDLTGLNGNGYTGSGQTIGLVEFSSYDQSDVNAYDSNYGLNVSAPTVVPVAGGTTDTSGAGEVDLDIQVIQALAPGANIKVYEAPNSTAGDEALYSQLVSDNVPIVSISWGQAESGTTDSQRNADDNTYQEASAQGQSYYAASGDSGSDDAGNGGTSVDYPASDPYVTGVGGTTLSANSDGSYAGETAWSGSGGGTSTAYSAPSYQSSLGITQREVPDVAAAADPSTGWAVYTGGAWQEIGGTSGAAPNWAAFTAIYNQYAAAKGGAKFGFANPTIYNLAGGSNYGSAFHDVTSGSNGAFSAGTGYDQVTGWGSYDGQNFITSSLG